MAYQRDRRLDQMKIYFVGIKGRFRQYNGNKGCSISKAVDYDLIKHIDKVKTLEYANDLYKQGKITMETHNDFYNKIKEI